jgi:dihydrolipoamide dehydrogenase
VVELTKLIVPDLGDFADVEVIELLVAPGDTVDVEDGIVTLETDKATMDVPASHAGKIDSLEVRVGDRVSTGDVIATVAAAAAEPAEEPGPDETQTKVPTPDVAAGDATHRTELVVIGAGPGGYTAAFRAADLGMQVILVERWETLGMLQR